MRAAVAARPGPPDVLAVREVPVPEPGPGWTVVRVKAAGINRSEIMTRLGFSPNVTFPRILGIECVGVIAGSVNPALPAGTTVAAIMGEMGREFDGGYAAEPIQVIAGDATALERMAAAAARARAATDRDVLWAGQASRRTTGGGPSSGR